MFGKLTLGVLVAALAVVTPAAPALAATATGNPPPTGKITIDLVTVNGNGCPAGSTSVAAASDNTALSVAFSGRDHQTGPGTGTGTARRSCQMALQVKAPQGYSYAISRVAASGVAHLGTGASATLRFNQYFQGSSAPTPLQRSFTGPLDEDWQTAWDIPEAELAYSSCTETRYLNLYFDGQVKRGTDTRFDDYVTVGPESPGVGITYALTWKRCAGA